MPRNQSHGWPAGWRHTRHCFVPTCCCPSLQPPRRSSSTLKGTCSPAPTQPFSAAVSPTTPLPQSQCTKGLVQCPPFKNSIVELPKRLLLHQGLLSSGQCLRSYSSFNLVTLGPIEAFGYCKCFHRCYCTRNTMEAYNL